MSLRLGVFCMVSMMLLSTATMAFDGQRKGFVMGGGVGYGPYTEWNWNDQRDDELHAGIAGNFLIGCAWDESNMAVMEFNGNSMNSDELSEVGTQLFWGPMWYHYFGDIGSSIFLAGGSLFYVAATEEEGMVGYGYLLGGGYEFSKQVQIGLYFGHGWPRKDRGDLGIGVANHINILLTVVAY